MPEVLFDAVGKLSLDGADKVNKGLDTVEAKANTIGKSLSSFGSNLTKYFTLPAIAAVVAIGAGLLKAGEQFDNAFDTIQMATGATGDKLEGLKNDFRETVKDVPSSFGDAGKAVADLNTRLGLTGKPLQDISKQMLNLANITNTDINTLIPLATRVFGDWSIATDKQSATLDYLYKVSANTGIGVDSLSAKVVQFGAPLRSMGFDFETSAAMIGKWEKEGVNTELVLSSMRIALGKFANEGVKDTNAALLEMIDKIKNAGSTGEATSLAMDTFGAKAGPDMAAAIREGRFELSQLVTDLKNSETTINGTQKATADFAETWATIKNKILIASEPIVKKFWEGLNKVATVVEEKVIPALQKMMPKIEPVMSLLIDKVFPIIIDKGIPIFERLITKIGELAQKFADLNPVQQDQILQWSGIALAAGPVLMIVGKLIPAITALKKVMGSTLGTVGLVATAILAIGEGASKVTEKWGGLNGTTGEWKRNLVSLALPQQELLLGFKTWPAILTAMAKGQLAWNDVSGLSQNQMYQLAEALRSGNTEMQNSIIAAGQLKQAGVDSMFASWGNNIKLAMQSVGDFFTTTIPTWWASIQTGAITIWANIQSFFVTTWEVIKGIFSGAWLAIQTNITNVLTNIQTFFTSTWETIKGIFSRAMDNIWIFMLRWVPFLQLIVDNWDAIVVKFTGWWNTIKTIFQTAFDWITGITNSWNANIRSFITGVWNGILTYFQGIWSNLITAFTTAYNWITGITNSWNANILNLFTSIWNSIAGFFANWWNNQIIAFNTALAFIQNLFAPAFNAISSSTISIWNGIAGFFSGLWGGIQSGVQSFRDFFIRMFGDIASGVRGPINSVIGFLNSLLSGVETAVNGLVNALNRIHISVPGWVGKIIPGLQGLNWSVSIPGVSVPHIPGLATGGLIERSGIATVGERGPETVLLPTGAKVVPNSGAGISNIYNIYSPKALNESELRRQIDSLSRSLAQRLGYAL